MKSICAWCDKVLDPGTGEIGEEITHDICGTCARGLKGSIKKMKMDGVTKEERRALLDFYRS